MAKLYDVYFTLAEPAVILLEAENKALAEEEFENLSKAELIERIINAIDFGGFEITKIERVDRPDQEYKLTLKEIYKKQLEYVRAITEDIYKHKCSEEIIKHAAKYAQVENCFDMFWRVNFGEIYGYVEVDTNPRIPSVYYNADEIGCYDTTYEEIVRALDAKTEEELANTDFGWCYDKILERGNYHLVYCPFDK